MASDAARYLWTVVFTRKTSRATTAGRGRTDGHWVVPFESRAKRMSSRKSLAVLSPRDLAFCAQTNLRVSGEPAALACARPRVSWVAVGGNLAIAGRLHPFAFPSMAGCKKRPRRA